MKKAWPINVRETVIGYIVTLALTVVLGLALTTLTLNGVVGEGLTHLGVYATLLVASLLGSVTANRKSTGAFIINAFILWLAVSLSLLITGVLFLDGRVGGWITNALCTLAGCLLGCTFCIRKRKIKFKHRKSIW